jgi:hypothetical protein
MSAPMNRIRWLVAGIALVLTQRGSVDAAAPASTEASSWLRAAVNADELDLAALVARIGDDVVLTSLSEGDSVLRLSAIRSAPYLVSKELALQPLAVLAQGRDPDLAPAAVRRALAIAGALALDRAANRELDLDTLQAAQRLLLALANAKSARADVRVCAGLSAHLLGTFSAPGSPI